MLDLLPPELLQTIVEYVGPPFWDEYTESERFANLSSLSLVSKRLQSFAQPLLFAVLTLQAAASDKLLSAYSSIARCEELVSNVRFLRCVDSRKPKSPLDSVAAHEIIQRIAMKGRNLTEMINPVLKSHWLSRFSGSTLKRLHVCHTSLEELEYLFLPELLELSSTYSHKSTRGIGHDQLPSLRHLSMCGGPQSVDGIVATLVTFIGQLDSLVLPIEYIPQIKERIPHLSLSRTLVDIGIGFDQVGTTLYTRYQSEIEHLRVGLAFDDFQDYDGGGEDLANFISLIKTATPSSPLRTIYVDSNLPPPHPQPSPEALKARSELIQACRDSNIEVVLEPQAQNMAWYSRISPDFVKRMSSSRGTGTNGERRIG